MKKFKIGDIIKHYHDPTHALVINVIDYFRIEIYDFECSDSTIVNVVWWDKYK